MSLSNVIIYAENHKTILRIAFQNSLYNIPLLTLKYEERLSIKMNIITIIIVINLFTQKLNVKRASVSCKYQEVQFNISHFLECSVF